MEYSQLEQERRNCRLSRAYVEEISGIPPATSLMQRRGSTNQIPAQERNSVDSMAKLSATLCSKKVIE